MSSASDSGVKRPRSDATSSSSGVVKFPTPQVSIAPSNTNAEGKLCARFGISSFTLASLYAILLTSLCSTPEVAPLALAFLMSLCTPAPLDKRAIFLCPSGYKCKRNAVGAITAFSKSDSDEYISAELVGPFYWLHLVGVRHVLADVNGIYLIIPPFNVDSESSHLYIATQAFDLPKIGSPSSKLINYAVTLALKCNFSKKETSMPNLFRNVIAASAIPDKDASDLVEKLSGAEGNDAAMLNLIDSFDGRDGAQTNRYLASIKGFLMSSLSLNERIDAFRNMRPRYTKIMHQAFSVCQLPAPPTRNALKNYRVNNDQIAYKKAIAMTKDDYVICSDKVTNLEHSGNLYSSSFEFPTVPAVINTIGRVQASDPSKRLTEVSLSDAGLTLLPADIFMPLEGKDEEKAPVAAMQVESGIINDPNTLF